MCAVVGNVQSNAGWAWEGAMGIDSGDTSALASQEEGRQIRLREEKERNILYTPRRYFVGGRGFFLWKFRIIRSIEKLLCAVLCDGSH